MRANVTRREFHAAVLLLLFLLSCAAFAQQQKPAADYVVSQPVANMYREPSLDAEVISQAIFSTNLVVAAGDSHKAPLGWLHVTTPDQYVGWMQSKDLQRLAGRSYGVEGRIVRVAQLSANIYRDPSVTRHAPIINVPWESRLEVLDEKVERGERWLKVSLPFGQTGYVQSGDVTSDFSPLSIPQTITLARRFLGITYTWGGTSSYGYDCSGFMQMLARQRGISLPRDAWQQASWSGSFDVDRANLAPGDLLYFGSKSKITHTGMYIGNGEFIHDTTNTHPGIQVSKLDDEPWTKLFVQARRIGQEASSK